MNKGPTETLIVGTTHGAAKVTLIHPRVYNVIRPQGHPQFGLLLGTVCWCETVSGSGWRFFPRFQAKVSRRLWPTPDAALKGRLHKYELEAKDA
jgi:hypothetical protein